MSRAIALLSPLIDAAGSVAAGRLALAGWLATRIGESPDDCPNPPAEWTGPWPDSQAFTVLIRTSEARKLAAAAAAGDLNRLVNCYESTAGLTRDRAGTLRHNRGLRLASGTFYTPEPVVEWLIAHTLSSATRQPLCVVDPTMGAGAFLVAAYRRTQGRAHCFGVDADLGAVVLARAQLARLGADPRALEETLVWGDALATAPGDSGLPPRYTWLRELPPLDVTLGNPPFLVEARGQRQRFAVLRENPEHASVYAKGADVALLVLALAVRITRPDGVVGLVLPAGWADRHGARRTRAFVGARATLAALLDSGGGSFFKATGTPQHAVVLKRHAASQSGAPNDAQPSPAPTTPAVYARVPEGAPATLAERVARAPAERRKARLEEPGLRLEAHATTAPRARPGRAAGGGGARLRWPPAALQQGAVPNPRDLTARMCETLAAAGVARHVGDPGFVIPAGHWPADVLTADERGVLVPFVHARQVTSGPPLDRTYASIVAFTGRVAASQDTPHEHAAAEVTPCMPREPADEADLFARFPTLAAHLAALRPLLEMRRETRRGIRPWWAMHWPRNRRWFAATPAERYLVSVRKARRPTVALRGRLPAYFDAGVVLIDCDALDPPADPWALLAVLNGETIAGQCRALKKQGSHVQVDVGVLRRLNVPARLVARGEYRAERLAAAGAAKIARDQAGG